MWSGWRLECGGHGGSGPIALTIGPPLSCPSRLEAVAAFPRPLPTPPESAGFAADGPDQGDARFLNRVNWGSNRSLQVPTGPFRCLVMITSVMPRSGVSGL